MLATARRLAPAFALTFAIAVAAAGCQKSASGDGSAATDMIHAPEMTLGNPNAKVTVVEYASDTCSHCARFDANVFPAFKAKYIDTGKVYYKFREFLTPPESVAAAGFLLARCAGKDKYFGVVEAIFRGQPELFATGDAHGLLLRIAQSAGLTEAQFNACEQDQAALDALQQRVKTALDNHIDSTPSLFVDGVALHQGDHEFSLADLDKAIQPKLK
jgi:protein-disulfide isomerase